MCCAKSLPIANLDHHKHSPAFHFNNRKFKIKSEKKYKLLSGDKSVVFIFVQFRYQQLIAVLTVSWLIEQFVKEYEEFQ